MFMENTTKPGMCRLKQYRPDCERIKARLQIESVSSKIYIALVCHNFILFFCVNFYFIFLYFLIKIKNLKIQ